MSLVVSTLAQLVFGLLIGVLIVLIATYAAAPFKSSELQRWSLLPKLLVIVLIIGTLVYNLSRSSIHINWSIFGPALGAAIVGTLVIFQMARSGRIRTDERRWMR